MMKHIKKQIQEFRELLNKKYGKTYKNGRYHIKTRSYGDYLYHQDPTVFYLSYSEWLETGEL